MDEFPRGYPNLAIFNDSDEKFMIYRRFGYLQSRLILVKQDELRLLEQKLDAVDKADMYDYPDRLLKRCTDAPGISDDEKSSIVMRKALINEIEKAYYDYCRCTR